VALEQNLGEHGVAAVASRNITVDAVRDGDDVTIVGVVRSVRMRPWADGADAMVVVAHGTGEIVVVLDGLGPLTVTAGVRIRVRGPVRETPRGWTMVPTELRANE
jgi:hypothetical protein